jgi:hypothetical protein
VSKFSKIEVAYGNPKSFMKTRERFGDFSRRGHPLHPLISQIH